MQSYELQFDTNAHMRQMEATTKEVHQSMQSTSKQMGGLEERLEKIEKLQSDLKEEQRRGRELLSEAVKRGAQASNGLVQFLEAHRITGTQVQTPPTILHLREVINIDLSIVFERFPTTNTLCAPGEQALIRSITPRPVRPWRLLAIDELSQILRIPIHMANDDLHRVIIERSWLRPGATESLLSYTRFQDWLVGAGSQALLVNGTDRDHVHDAISSMSILAVDIMSSLMNANRQGQVAVLHFFCGLHSDAKEGPRMMIRSLISQIMILLQRYRCLNLEFIDSQAFMTDLENDNFAALLYTFQKLCRQLPQYLTVYCFIDGIPFYESRSSYFPFYDNMVDFLRGITQTILASGTAASSFVTHSSGYGSSGPIFNLKVLFTTAAGTLFDRYITNRIDLPKGDVDSSFASGAFDEEISAYVGDGRYPY